MIAKPVRANNFLKKCRRAMAFKKNVQLKRSNKNYQPYLLIQEQNPFCLYIIVLI